MFRGSVPPSLILLRLLHPSRTLPHPRRSPYTTTPTPHSIAKPTARAPPPRNPEIPTTSRRWSRAVQQAEVFAVKRANCVERVEDRRVARRHHIVPVHVRPVVFTVRNLRGSCASLHLTRPETEVVLGRRWDDRHHAQHRHLPLQ